MKQTITFLRVTGRRLMGLIKKLLRKAAHRGILKIGVAIGFPPLFTISLSYDAKFGEKADNDSREIAKIG